MFNLVLVSPKIPQNTGTIGRTVVSIGAKLHIIKPIPFCIEEKKLKRAGMDYWNDLDWILWDDLNSFLVTYPLNDRHFFLTTKGKKYYFDCDFKVGDFFYFGSEDAGLPMDLMQKKVDQMLKIPMKSKYRSLNQANAASVIMYEALRQNFTRFITNNKHF